LSDQGRYPDFKKLTKRLTAYGSVVFAEFSLGGRDAVVPGTGLSIEDFVAKVLLEYAIGKIKHHKSRGALMTVLGTAMRNDIIDALRKKSHEREETRSSISVNEDAEVKDHEKPALDDYPQQFAPDPASVVDENEYSERVRSAVEDEPALKEVVEAVLDLELYKPEEIADAVGTSAAEIQNRKKKLRRRLRKEGLVSSRRKKAESYEESHS
jgi:RNA polymerase sigma factor (sigma-70 family)